MIASRGERVGGGEEEKEEDLSFLSRREKEKRVTEERKEGRK